MASHDNHLESLTHRYRRRVERSLKAEIRKARDREFAAALYTSSLQAYLLLCLQNPFLAEARQMHMMGLRLGWTQETLLSEIALLRQRHRAMMEAQRQERRNAEEAENLKPPSMGDLYFSEVDATAPLVHPADSLRISFEFDSYSFLPQHLEGDDLRPIVRLLARVAAITEVVGRIREEHGLDDGRVLELLEQRAEGREKETEASRTEEALADSPTPKVRQDDEVMNVEQAAAYLGMAVQTLYEKTSKRLVPHSKPYGRLLFSRRELDLWIRDGKVHTQADIDRMAEGKLAELEAKRKQRRGKP